MKDRVEQALCGLLLRQSNHVPAADILTMKVCQFWKDRGEQARYAFLLWHFTEMVAADIGAMKVWQFQKDRDEQANNNDTLHKSS